MTSEFDQTVPKIAYEVILSPEGNLERIERSTSGEARLYVELGTLLQRSLVDVLSIMPIEWLL